MITIRNLSLLKSKTQGRDKGKLELTVEGVGFKTLSVDFVHICPCGTFSCSHPQLLWATVPEPHHYNRAEFPLYCPKLRFYHL